MNDNDALGDSLRVMRQEGASIDEAAQRTGADPADVELVAGLSGLRGATPAGADAGFVKARFLDSIGEERKMGFFETIFSSPLRTIAAAAVVAVIAGGLLGAMDPGGVNGDVGGVLGVNSSDDDDDNDGATVTPTSTPDVTVTPQATGTPGVDDDDDDDDDGRNRGPGGDDDDDDDDDNSGPGNGGDDDDDDDNSNSGPGGGDDDDDDDNSGSGGGDD